MLRAGFGSNCKGTVFPRVNPLSAAPTSISSIRAESRSRSEAAAGRWVWWALAWTVLLAAGLRVFRLDHGGLWYDELIMARITTGTWSGLWTEIMHGRPPVYLITGALWSACFGTSDVALRSLSAVMGVATVPIVFLIGRRLFNPRVGLVAALLLSVSPFQVYYSQENRYYALMLMLSTMSIWLVLKALRVGDPKAERQSGDTVCGEKLPCWVWPGYMMTSVLAFYTHTFFLFLLISIGVAVLAVYRRGAIAPFDMTRFLRAQVVVLAVILPWCVVKMWYLLERMRAADGGEGVVVWLSAPPWWAPVRTVGNFMLLGARFINPTWALIGGAVLLVGVAVAMIRGGGLVAAARDAGRALMESFRGRSGAWWITACWALGPMLLVATISWTLKPVYVDRYLIASAAGLYLLVAAGIVAVSRVLPCWAGLGLILLAMAGSLNTYYELPQKGAWPQAAAWLDRQLVEGEALAFSSERGTGRETPHVRANWFWYAETDESDEYAEIDVSQDVTSIARQLKAACGSRPAVWLVMWRNPDRSLGVDLAFADGPVEGMALDSVKKFFDLTLMRFEWIDWTPQADGSSEPPVESAEVESVEIDRPTQPKQSTPLSLNSR